MKFLCVYKQTHTSFANGLIMQLKLRLSCLATERSKCWFQRIKPVDWKIDCICVKTGRCLVRKIQLVMRGIFYGLFFLFVSTKIGEFCDTLILILMLLEMTSYSFSLSLSQSTVSIIIFVLSKVQFSKNNLFCVNFREL